MKLTRRLKSWNKDKEKKVPTVKVGYKWIQIIEKCVNDLEKRKLKDITYSKDNLKYGVNDKIQDICGETKLKKYQKNEVTGS